MSLPRLSGDEYQQAFTMSYDHVELTADLTVKLFKVPSGRKIRVDGVKYVNPTGLAQDASNYFNLKLLKGASTVAFNWSTHTGDQGSIAADTFVDFAASSTDADKVFDGGDVMSIFFDETGTSDLPAGRLVIYGRYV